MDLIRSSIQPRLAELAVYLGLYGAPESLPDIFMNELESLLSRIGIPRKYNSLGISEDDVEWLTSNALKVRRLLDNSPMELGFEEIRRIYRGIV